MRRGTGPGPTLCLTALGDPIARELMLLPSARLKARRAPDSAKAEHRIERESKRGEMCAVSGPASVENAHARIHVPRSAPEFKTSPQLETPIMASYVCADPLATSHLSHRDLLNDFNS